MVLTSLISHFLDLNQACHSFSVHLTLSDMKTSEDHTASTGREELHVQDMALATMKP